MYIYLISRIMLGIFTHFSFSTIIFNNYFPEFWTMLAVTLKYAQGINTDPSGKATDK